MNQEHEMPARIWIDKSLGMVGYINGPPPPESNFRYEYVRADLLATVRREKREAALTESAESIINEAGKVGQLMDLASASARKEEREAVKSMLEDYFKHFFCTCHGSTRTGGHFASCPVTIRDEVLGRLAALETSANQKGEVNG